MTHRYEVELAGRPLIIETGDLAQQAGGAVTLRYGDSMLLGTVTASTPRKGIDFFPLTVEFEERHYATGRIPGSFFRREGRPTTTAVLSARLTDRPLRPLFPSGYKDETQIVITILSVDMENPPDTLGTIAASAALTISDVPFLGPVASVRVGRVNDELVLQPTFSQLAESDLDLVVSGTKDAIMMVEAEAQEVPEQLLVDAMALGQEAIAQIVALQEQMQAEVGREKRSYTAAEVSGEALARVEAAVGSELAAVLTPSSEISKAERDNRRNDLQARILDGLDDETESGELAEAFAELEKRIVRSNILERGQRPDGRSLKDLRALRAEVGMVPRTHGSGLFQRGETQVLSLTTLAGTGMAQRLDDLSPASSKRFMHHYNFPPYSVGETGRIGSTNRREVGHGMLGERAMSSILPEFDDFPYTIRIVSEVLSSNGSTSMASVCAAILSMMDAGVPMKTPIAGAAMGLIKGEDKYAVLTDIAGLEDHLGDMDFKVAGSRVGVTALQMDIKVKGITLEIISEALEQATEARLQILDVMQECIAEPRAELAAHAPRMSRVEVPADKIGAIIGPGGKTIRQLEENTGASIDVEDDGGIFVTAPDAESAQKAVDLIKALTKEIEPGEIYTGKVVRTLPFGAFVELVPGKDALVHISELAEGRVATVEDVVKVGDELKVVVTEIDHLGRVNASRRALLVGEDREAGGGGAASAPREREPRDRPPRDRPPRDRPPGDRPPGDRPPGDRPPRDRPPGDRPPGDRAPSDRAPSERPPDKEQSRPVEQTGAAEGERDRAEGAGTSSAGGGEGGEAGGDGRRRRRRRRRRGAADGGGERPERQPDSNAGGRSPAWGGYSRGASRRGSSGSSSDEPPPPPPPPRPDFGAPAR